MLQAADNGARAARTGSRAHPAPKRTHPQECKVDGSTSTDYNTDCNFSHRVRNRTAVVTKVHPLKQEFLPVPSVPLQYCAVVVF